jgi:NAD(P)H-nitrite reductase large subunit
VDDGAIIDRLKMVCQCKGIRKRAVLQAMAAGCTGVASVQRFTGAGSGDCGGRRCTPRIADILAGKLGAG